MEYSNKDWRRIDHAVEANRSLRSFGIEYGFGSTPASFIDHLCMNETLKNINCGICDDDVCSGESRANHSMCICFIFNFKMVIIHRYYTTGRQLSEVPVSST